MTYLILKWVHILSSTLMFGTGVGTVFYKMMVCRTGNLQAMAIVLRYVVLADWLFTLPSVIIQPLTGFAMVYRANWPLSSPWLFYSILLYLLAAACWLPAVWIQIKLRDMVKIALESDQPLSKRFYVYERAWLALGFPSFFAMLTIFWLMVSKHV